jgi:hypothetical protein
MNVVAAISNLTTCLEIGPLSLWERVRVRANDSITIHFPRFRHRCLHPLPLSQRERGDFQNTFSNLKIPNPYLSINP